MDALSMDACAFAAVSLRLLLPWTLHLSQRSRHARGCSGAERVDADSQFPFR